MGEAVDTKGTAPWISPTVSTDDTVTVTCRPRFGVDRRRSMRLFHRMAPAGVAAPTVRVAVAVSPTLEAGVKPRARSFRVRRGDACDCNAGDHAVRIGLVTDEVPAVPWLVVIERR